MFKHNRNSLGLIAYEPRSGSTIISKFITENTHAIVLPECHLIITLLTSFEVDKIINSQVKDRISKIIDNDRKISDWGIEQELKQILLYKKKQTISDFVRKTIEVLQKKYATNKYLILKKESYLIVLHQLVKVFSDLNIIFIVRDPRAVVASQKKSLYTKTKKPFSNSITKTAISWNLQLKRLSIVARHNINAQIIKYEDFVTNPSQTIKSVLPEDLNMPSQQKTKYMLPKKYEVLHRNVLNPPSAQVSLNWEHSLRWYERLLVELICCRNMKYLQYETSKFSNLMHAFKLTTCFEYLQSAILELKRFSSKLSWSRGMMKVDPKY